MTDACHCHWCGSLWKLPQWGHYAAYLWYLVVSWWQYCIENRHSSCWRILQVDIRYHLELFSQFSEWMRTVFKKILSASFLLQLFWKSSGTDFLGKEECRETGGRNLCCTQPSHDSGCASPSDLGRLAFAQVLGRLCGSTEQRWGSRGISLTYNTAHSLPGVDTHFLSILSTNNYLNLTEKIAICAWLSWKCFINLLVFSEYQTIVSVFSVSTENIFGGLFSVLRV